MRPFRCPGLLIPLVTTTFHRKKQTSKNAKVARDDNQKDLFENGDWARNDITMERVGRSVLVYSFIKDGQAKGERVDASVSTICSGQTFRFRLQDFMYEEKKGGDSARNVFPSDVDVIPQFSVIEVMFSPANQGQFEQGYGLSVARVRPCDFSLYSMQSPLGLGLLPGSYEESVRLSEGYTEHNPGLKRVLEDKSTGFFGRVTQGSYIIKYNDDYRIVGPKENPTDPQSKHLNVMEGGVFAIDMHRDDLLRFANAGESEVEDSLIYAQFLVDFAAAAGALDFYVTYNEYLLRQDPNRSPFTGAPLIDSHRLLEFIRTEEITGEPGQRFPLPFDFSMDRPFLALTPVPEDPERSGEEPRPCSDFAITSQNAHVGGDRIYTLSLGDATEEDIQTILFVPKSGAGGGNRMLLGRQDYRMLKKRKAED